ICTRLEFRRVLFRSTHVPLDQRQQWAALAEQLRGEADAALARELAAAELGAAPPTGETPRTSAGQVPRPLATVAVSPSVAAARRSEERRGGKEGRAQ